MFKPEIISFFFLLLSGTQVVGRIRDSAEPAQKKSFFFPHTDKQRTVPATPPSKQAAKRGNKRFEERQQKRRYRRSMRLLEVLLFFANTSIGSSFWICAWHISNNHIYHRSRGPTFWQRLLTRALIFRAGLDFAIICKPNADRSRPGVTNVVAH